METREEVNHNKRQRGYGARDKDELIAKIIELHKRGNSQVEIAKILKISRGTILRWNKELEFFKPRTPGEAGKLKSKVYSYNENYFDKIITPNQAYIVGFILGDGTLYDRGKSKRLVITLAAEDKQILYDIATELNMAEAIKFRKKSVANEQDKYSLIINSTKMCDDLMRLGVKPQKTGKEKWINFHNHKLQWAFLRGFFDADGHVGVYGKENRTVSRVGFTGSREMLLSILLFLKSQNIGNKVNAISKKQGCFDLRLSNKNDLIQLYNYLYKDGDIKLNRKFNKYSSLMI
ncbi:LAGLIDADG family homing endonuclease [Cytobacillus sp. S13-E01]|uniref:LAGLIDADG family homing endonuclease n=1 Tax=Cytobacillus sp. S13-E01 TaxID=3031326 RepID=UPI0023D86113|nr:LAGLIDADG family homing endonuclease [Cytobacillus sp. S13-E01]MDF0727320.1 LAGLIDADG family homing endonuclease [Cytobacillus sp. S13-E01]